MIVEEYLSKNIGVFVKIEENIRDAFNAGIKEGYKMAEEKREPEPNKSLLTWPCPNYLITLLNNIGIWHINQLCDRTLAEYLKIKGFGYSSLSHVLGILAANRLKLKPDENMGETIRTPFIKYLLRKFPVESGLEEYIRKAENET